MKKLNFGNMSSIQGAQAAIDDQYQRQINEARFKAVRDYSVGQQAKNQFETLAESAINSAGAKGLDPTIADAYRQQGAMYRALASQLQYTDPDKYGETIQRFMASTEDPRKLANELRRTEIMANAGIQKANIYASGNNPGFGQITYSGQPLMPSGNATQKAKSFYDLVGGLFNQQGQ